MATTKKAKATTKKKATKKKAAKAKAAKAKPLGDELEALLAAIPSERVALNPDQPVAQFAALASRSGKAAAGERTKLLRLPAFQLWWLRCGDLGVALAAAETEWGHVYGKTRAGVGPARKREGEAVKSKLVEDGRYLLRDIPEAQEELDQIAIGTGVADLALDLQRLVAMVERYPAYFLDHDDKLTERATTLAIELRDGIEPEGAAELQDRRNRLYWLTQDATRQVRAGLRYVWREQPHKIAELGVTYASQLQKDARAKKKQQKKDPA